MSLNTWYKLFEYPFYSIILFQLVQSLIKQLCTTIIPEETTLVENNCKLLSNLIQNNMQLERQTFMCCKEWILKVLRTASPIVYSEILLTLKNILLSEQYDDVNHVSVYFSSYYMCDTIGY